MGFCHDFALTTLPRLFINRDMEATKTARSRQEVLAELKRLSKLIRQGRATPEQERRYEVVDAEWLAFGAPAKPVRSIWDLDVSASCWRGDARAVDRYTVDERNELLDRWDRGNA